MTVFLKTKTIIKHPALQNGLLTNYTDPNIVSFVRQLSTDQVWKLVNTRNTSGNYSVPSLFMSNRTDAITGIQITVNSHLNSNPYEYRVYVK